MKKVAIAAILIVAAAFTSLTVSSKSAIVKQQTELTKTNKSDFAEKGFVAHKSDLSSAD